VQRDGQPGHLGCVRREPAVEQELPRVIGAVQFETLLPAGERHEKARVMEHRRDKEQLGIGPQIQPLRVEGGEEKNTLGVMEDQGIRLLPEKFGGSAAAGVPGMSTPAMMSVMMFALSHVMCYE
jgi:hypothetical protein